MSGFAVRRVKEAISGFAAVHGQGAGRCGQQACQLRPYHAVTHKTLERGVTLQESSSLASSVGMEARMRSDSA
jgi:hypothetical protein